MSSITVEQHRQPKFKINPCAAATAGAAVGVAGRYLLPAKNSKNTFDTFVKSAGNRAAQRSILKYAGIGALIGAGISYIASKFSTQKTDIKTPEYTRYGAVIDAPADSAYAIVYYGD